MILTRFTYPVGISFVMLSVLSLSSPAQKIRTATGVTEKGSLL